MKLGKLEELRKRVEFGRISADKEQFILNARDYEWNLKDGSILTTSFETFSTDGGLTFSDEIFKDLNVHKCKVGDKKTFGSTEGYIKTDEDGTRKIVDYYFEGQLMKSIILLLDEETGKFTPEFIYIFQRDLVKNRLTEYLEYDCNGVDPDDENFFNLATLLYEEKYLYDTLGKLVTKYETTYQDSEKISFMYNYTYNGDSIFIVKVKDLGECGYEKVMVCEEEHYFNDDLIFIRQDNIKEDGLLDNTIYNIMAKINENLTIYDHYTLFESDLEKNGETIVTEEDKEETKELEGRTYSNLEYLEKKYFFKNFINDLRDIYAKETDYKNQIDKIFENHLARVENLDYYILNGNDINMEELGHELYGSIYANYNNRLTLPPIEYIKNGEATDIDGHVFNLCDEWSTRILSDFNNTNLEYCNTYVESNGVSDIFTLNVAGRSIVNIVKDKENDSILLELLFTDRPFGSVYKYIKAELINK